MDLDELYQMEDGDLYKMCEGWDDETLKYMADKYWRVATICKNIINERNIQLKTPNPSSSARGNIMRGSRGGKYFLPDIRPKKYYFNPKFEESGGGEY